MAPLCSKHPEKEMSRVFCGAEIIGDGWNRHQAYFEDYLCELCGFRLRLHYTVIDIGRERSDGK